MKPGLQRILDILDEGLVLYRRGFWSFLTISLLWVVPVLVGIGLTVAIGAAGAAIWSDDGGFLLLLLGWMVLLMFIVFSLLAMLSRAALLVQQGERIRLRALVFSPLRLAGMGCYGSVFFLTMSIATSMISMICFCPLSMVITTFLSGFATVADPGAGGILMMIGFSLIMGTIFFLTYALNIAITGAVYSSLVYAIQPFVQERHLSVWDAVRRSLALTAYRIGYNLLAFVLASLLFFALSLAVVIAVGVLLPLPLLWGLGGESPIAKGGSALAWFLGLTLVLPPLPIWMALLYQRNLAAYQGKDLAEQIAAHLHGGKIISQE